MSMDILSTIYPPISKLAPDGPQILVGSSCDPASAASSCLLLLAKYGRRNNSVTVQGGPGFASITSFLSIMADCSCAVSVHLIARLGIHWTGTPTVR